MVSASDEGFVADLGRRVASHRSELDLTQEEFAERAGISRSTLQRIEAGGSIQLSSFVKILRALRRLEVMDTVLERDPHRPLADLEQQRKRRKRVRHPGRGSRDPRVSEAEWTWDEGGDS